MELSKTVHHQPGEIHDRRFSAEKRHIVRRPVNISVEFIVLGCFYCGFIKNMNKDGVFIETKNSFSVGRVVSMTYANPHFGESNKIGKIARGGQQGIWVKFIFFSSG